MWSAPCFWAAACETTRERKVRNEYRPKRISLIPRQEQTLREKPQTQPIAAASEDGSRTVRQNFYLLLRL